MNGPTNKLKNGLGLDNLEIASVAAGAVVVLGLLLESGPEMWQAIINWKIPAREVVGGALVALGVFGEVAIGIFISRSAKREKVESDSLIAAANERAAAAEERTANLQIEIGDARERQADAEKLLAGLRRAQAPRASVFNGSKFSGFLEPRAKGTAEIFVKLEDGEAFQFAGLLRESLILAGWTVRELTTLSPGLVQSGLPAMLALGGQSQGITILSRLQPSSLGDPYKVLADAFIFVDFPIVGRIIETVPEGELRIIVGPKP